MSICIDSFYIKKPLSSNMFIWSEGRIMCDYVKFDFSVLIGYYY